ncbi:N-(5'-phosphoribosyl)anthranilate isomerase [subsurface metagenome]
MSIRVKICGITRPEDALFAEKAGASAVGFIFYPKSPRYIDPESVKEISGKLGPFISRIGVFVNEDPDEILHIFKTARLSAVQLHGSEKQEFIEKLNGIPVIKAFRVGKIFDCDELSRYDANAYLLDTYDPDSMGGTGKTFDWEIARRCGSLGKVILAGGLNESNISEAINSARPWAVDVSSGVESEPGIKDIRKIRALFQAVKEA